jgi:hypothetical protein
MDSTSKDDDRSGVLSSSASLNGSYSANSHVGRPANGVDTGGTTNGYTLMVAGRRSGKTSFLRLLLDTCDISPTATKEQLASVAKFVQGSNGHTSHIRTAAIDIELDMEGNGFFQRLTLSLIDTPSIAFEDESFAERVVSETLRHVDSRFAEGMEDVCTFIYLPYSLLILHTGLECPGWRPSRSFVRWPMPSDQYLT